MLLSAQMFSPVYPNAVSKNNLILEYDFSNAACYTSGTTVNNLVGLSIPGTLANSPKFFADPGYIRFSNANSQYLIFGGLASYHSATSSSTRTGVFTISFWFNPASNNGVVLADLGQNTINTSYHTADIEMVGGYLKFSVWPRNTILTTSSTLSLNTWYYVSLVYDGANMKAYLNGSLVGSATYTRQGPHMGSLSNSSASSNDQYFAMAATDATNMGSGTYNSFLLPDIKFYATALSSNEIYQNYLAEKSRYDLVFYVDGSSNQLSYPGSGSTWNDISGAAKTGTNAAGAYYNAAVGGSMYYNGTTSGYTDFSFNLNGASTITVEMWVYPTVFNGGMFFGFNRFDVWSNGGALGYNSAASDQYGLTASQVSSLGLLNNWKHYVFVMNAGDYLSKDRKSVV